MNKISLILLTLIIISQVYSEENNTNITNTDINEYTMKIINPIKIDQNLTKIPIETNDKINLFPNLIQKETIQQNF